MGNYGKLIVFEGIDGTGKSTQIEMLAQYLIDAGHQVVTTREPTDGPYGLQIRELYVSRDYTTLEDELALFLADRRQHVEELIRPALEQGSVVISDRYFLSTAAYQGALGLEPEQIMIDNENFAPLPDLAILIELQPAEAVMRIKRFRQESLNAFEHEEGLKKVAAVFAGLERDYIRRLNGKGGIDDVHNTVVAYVKEILG